MLAQGRAFVRRGLAVGHLGEDRVELLLVHVAVDLGGGDHRLQHPLLGPRVGEGLELLGRGFGGDGGVAGAEQNSPATGSANGVLDLLALLEEAADFASGTRAFALVMQLQDGIALLIDKLSPDLPEADPA